MIKPATSLIFSEKIYIVILSSCTLKIKTRQYKRYKTDKYFTYATFLLNIEWKVDKDVNR